jgi:putative two-component system response regulator
MARHPETARFFATRDQMAHARTAQKRHWLTHILSGRFDEAYGAAALAVGRAHFFRDVDLLLYMGSYSVALDKMVEILSQALSDDDTRCHRYIRAITKAVFLDMGLSTSVYYDMEVTIVQELSTDLNASLARAGEYRDNDTGKHLYRMSRMCGLLATAIGKESSWIRMIVMASPLHDVGKIGIPDRILLKPGPLNDDEMAIMRDHPTIGGDIIPNNTAAVILMAKRISLTHHERWDGTGYPSGLAGEAIPLEGRIAAICDVFDALVSRRPYKKAWAVEDAAAYLRDNAGRHFDPALVDAFLAHLPQMVAIQAEFAETD